MRKKKSSQRYRTALGTGTGGQELAVKRLKVEISFLLVKDEIGG